jgi:hypothetical protein
MNPLTLKGANIILTALSSVDCIFRFTIEHMLICVQEDGKVDADFNFQHETKKCAERILRFSFIINAIQYFRLTRNAEQMSNAGCESQQSEVTYYFQYDADVFRKAYGYACVRSTRRE